MHIRRATVADVETLARFRVALLEETGAHMLAEDRDRMRQLNESFFRQNVTSSSWGNWLAEFEGEVIAVGTLAFFDRPPYPGNPEGKDAYFLNMYTLPAHRGRGAAKLVLQASLQEAKARGVRKLILHATESGHPMYAQAGFQASQAYMELSIQPE